jgi:plasmid stabilization system protein ParE
MKRFILTPRAKQDVNDIWDYIANDNIEAADRVLDAMENAMIKLPKKPGIAARDVRGVLGLAPDAHSHPRSIARDRAVGVG